MRNGTFRTLPFFAQGMLENIGVAQAVNDMLLTSHGYGLRLFPIWAALRPDESASFATLRGKGQKGTRKAPRKAPERPCRHE